MGPYHNLLLELVNKFLLPHTERCHEASHHDLGLIEAIDVQQHVPLSEGKARSKMKLLDRKTLEECDLLLHVLGSKGKGPITQMIFDLQKATARVADLEMENAQLKTDLSTAHAEMSRSERRPRS
ncbi:hypothetical protein HAX54_021699 [Datura stramonium]|uniref:Uncharacterized protein n=1 Tax=Datura stramonium TaxID=4076 RepID=A0ABS8UVK2_DATST|nr:hypothetical protein [Datura stramonium]